MRKFCQMILVVTIFSLFSLLLTPQALAQCAPLPTDTGKVITTVTVNESGLYTVWSRMQAASSVNDSFWLQIDDTCPINVGDGSLTPNVWTWVNYRDGDPDTIITANLTAGSHTITLVGRESGVKVDRVSLLGNPTCIPTGKGDDCLTDLSASIKVTPASGSATLTTPLTVDLVVDGGGQAFNAAEATVTVSPNMSVTNLTAPTSDACNLSYTGTPPSASNPSFAGAILSGSSTKCTVYTLTLTPTSAGTGTITISNASVKAYSTNNELFQSSQNGSYTLTMGSSTPTPTIVNPTATSTPTNTPIPPTPTPTRTPTPTPTITPTPKLSLTPALTPPVIEPPKNLTYQASSFLTGTKKPGDKILVNNSSTSVVYPSDTSWQVVRPLLVGNNEFAIVIEDSSGNKSEPTIVTLRRNKLGDINGDNFVDLTDLSLFANDWQKTNNFSNILSDNNEDGRINLTDLSILAKQYGK